MINSQQYFPNHNYTCKKEKEKKIPKNGGSSKAVLPAIHNAVVTSACLLFLSSSSKVHFQIS